MTIGEQIKELREKNNVSQEKLAEALHVSRQTVSRWENNENFPNVKKLSEIALFFKLSENYFFRQEENHSDSVPNFADGALRTLTPLTEEEAAVATSACPPPNASSDSPESENKDTKNSKKKIIITIIFFILGLLTAFFVWLFDYLHYLEIKKAREAGWIVLETFTISTTDWFPLITFLVGVILVVVCGGVLIWNFIKRKKEKENHEKKK